MSINKLSHLKEWEKIYLEVTKADCEQDIHPYYKFNDGYGDKMLNVNTYNSVSYTLDDLKQLANDGMLKQEITVDGSLWDRWSKVNFKWTLKTLPEKGDLINGMPNDNMPKQEVEWTLLKEKLLHSLWLHKKLPIQWERVEIRAVHQWTTSTWDEAIFVCFFLNKPLVKFDDDTFDVFDEWRFPPQKTELTLAEVEERLWLEKGSLIIKD